ncbi:MAG TPA: hypothetical protein VJ180_06170, partial [Pyrinomonadaceae bacterium]|nr:hypothetical protein [Pyrinomonadaceae bacterium]
LNFKSNKGKPEAFRTEGGRAAKLTSANGKPEAFRTERGRAAHGPRQFTFHPSYLILQDYWRNHFFQHCLMKLSGGR